MKIIALFLSSLLFSCMPAKQFLLPVTTSAHGLTGSAFYQLAASYNWQKRDSLAETEILAGNIPSFLKKFVRVDVRIKDSASNKLISAYYFVAPDYLSIGDDNDWARIPLTPMSAQRICDSFQCFLPTRKMVDDIYRAAVVKLTPVPMFAFRDSTITMWQHHLVIEEQRKGKKGLIAGIKKDVVISSKISSAGKRDRVAIYGWHKPDGRPIQPLYTGHANWYVDYSHGARMVYRKIYVNGKAMDYTEVLQHPVLHRLLCDEERCDFYRY
jgi:hypothetical protein